MLLEIVILLAGFGVLILGAEWLVTGASSLARRLKLSEMMIGLTIVAFGTSTPELVVNLIATQSGQDDVIFGNVIGSNIFNLLLILGVSGTILPFIVQQKTVWREIPFSFLAILVLLLLVNTGQGADRPVLNRWEGAVLLSLFLLFTWYVIRNLKNTDVSGTVLKNMEHGSQKEDHYAAAEKEDQYTQAEKKGHIAQAEKDILSPQAEKKGHIAQAEKDIHSPQAEKEGHYEGVSAAPNGGRKMPGSPVFSSLKIIIGLALLVAGGRLVVDKSTNIASTLGMSERLIGLTIISIGTSLPELATSVVAAIRKKSDLAIGNIIGSNIFNILLILGICAMVRPVGYNLSLNQDLLILGAFTLFLFVAMFTGKRKKLDRWEAIVLLVSFFGYMIYIVSRN